MSETNEAVIVVGPRRRGRPRSSEPMSKISAHIPARHYDALAGRAQAERMSLSEYVRTMMDRALSMRS
jgi:hypothetical protein